MRTYTAADIAALRDKRDRLVDLRATVDAELADVTATLHQLGALQSRALLPPTHTVDEARDAHRRFNAGDRDEWVVAGERQYQRDRKRRYDAARRRAELTGKTRRTA